MSLIYNQEIKLYVLCHSHHACSYVHYFNQRLHSIKCNTIVFKNIIRDKYRTSTYFGTGVPPTGVYYNKVKQVQHITVLGVYSLFQYTAWGWHSGVETCRSLICFIHCILLFVFYCVLLNTPVFKKRPNFLNSVPTSTEGALRLLCATTGRFWQQTAVCPISLWASVVELQPLNWARAQAVHRINPTNSLCTFSVQRM